MGRKRRRGTHTVEIFADAINRELHETLTAAGYGTAAKIERLLGLYQGYFAQKRRAHTIDSGVLLAALHLLGIDYESFLRGALRDLDSEEVTRVVAAKRRPPDVESPEARRILSRYGVLRGMS